MLALDERPLSQLHGISPYHRYQAGALLQGHFYLADSIAAIQPGLAWHDGQVQQVWGLGVGLWLLPFQAVWRLFGGKAFPERIALGVAFAMLAFYAACTALRMARQGNRMLALGLLWSIVLCPALWTLARASQLVFEETVLYGVLVSLGILVSLVRVVWFGSRTDYLACCSLGAFAAWVRPTDAIYGLAAALMSAFFVWRRKRAAHRPPYSAFRPLCSSLPAIFLWLASMGLLAWTNEVRFGAPAEFGHRLTVSSGSMMYLTRFGNPFRQVPPLDAAKELFGLLFLNRDVRDAGAFAENLFPGQSSATRWRRLYLTAFDTSYAGVGLAASVVAIVWLALRQRRQPTGSAEQPRTALVITLLVWSSASMAALGGFYLYYPAMASRYLFDFAPAVTGMVMLAWVLVSARWGKYLWPLLVAWFAFEIITAKAPTTPVQHQHVEPALPKAIGNEIKDFGGLYTVAHHPAETGISGNGYGWDPETGSAAAVVSLAADKPEFLELRVSARHSLSGNGAGKDVYRAQIDGQELPLRSVQSDTAGCTVQFSIPPSVRSRRQDEVVFLCFCQGYDATERSSERVLHSVRWR